MRLARAGKLALAVLAGAGLFLWLWSKTLHGGGAVLWSALFGPICLTLVGVLAARLDRAIRRERALKASMEELRAGMARLEGTLTMMEAANTRLQESEAHYRGLVDGQGEPILRRAPDSRLTYGNDAFFRLFGLDRQDAIGRPFAPEPHPESRHPQFGSFAGTPDGPPRVRYDQHVRTAHGWRWIAWEDFAIRDASGQLLEIQSAGRDITDRKALEAALIEARDKAEAASRAKSGFLATMSHEIRTPMNGVLGMARLLMETRLEPGQRSYTEAIVQSGETLLALIEDILDFSRIEAGSLQLEAEAVHVAGAVSGVIELLAPRADGKGIALEAVIAPDVPETITADGMRLRQVLTNLIGNAVKFTERGGVLVRVRPERRRGAAVLRFSVRDSGVGVPKDKRAHIFEEFVQADSSHARRFGGTGLGLAISKRLVHAMGGEIGVDAAPGGGSLFWFTVPISAEAAAADPGPPLLYGKKALILSRNRILREALAEQIRHLGGEIVAADQGWREAHLLLVDAGTGDMIDLAGEARHEIPSFVLISPSARRHLPGLLDAGFTGYLMKPVRQASLARRLADPAPMSIPCQDEERTSEPNMTSGLAILLAEDNAINAMLTSEFLRRRGHWVRCVDNGRSALEALARERFDLVLTDIHMPGMDGIEMARRIRADEKRNQRPHTPIVALTADVLETGHETCQEAGMDGFLTKPIQPAELDTMLTALFSPSGLKGAAA